MNLDVTVVIAAHSTRRWRYLQNAVESVRQQRPCPAALFVVVDHNEELLARARHELDDVVVLSNRYNRGASGTRNTGAERAETEFIAFLDDDARAHAGWIEGLLEPFEDSSIVGTGGGVRPVWEAGCPRWFPAEFNWVVGASYIGMPITRERIRNVWSENMAVRRSTFEAVGGFRLGFGKLGDRSRPEDTDLCIRMAATAPDAGWLHVPDAVADHQVPKTRSTFSFYLRRCYYEGRGKIEMARLLSMPGSLASERDYLRRVLPRGVASGLLDACKGRPVGAARAGAIVAGVCGTAVGVARAHLGIARSHRRVDLVTEAGAAR